MTTTLGFLLGLYIVGYIAVFVAIGITCGLKAIPWWAWLLTPYYPVFIVWCFLEEATETVQKRMTDATIFMQQRACPGCVCFTEIDRLRGIIKSLKANNATQRRKRRKRRKHHEKHRELVKANAIIEWLPRTKNGVVITLNMTLYWESYNPDTLAKGKQVSSLLIYDDGWDAFWCELDGSEYAMPSDFGLYSTSEAALEAALEATNNEARNAQASVMDRAVENTKLTTDLEVERTGNNARLATERNEVQTQLDTVCGSIPPADMAAWIEEYGSCENCALDLIGFNDRPYRTQCEECARRQESDDAAAWKAELAQAKADSDKWRLMAEQGSPVMYRACECGGLVVGVEGHPCDKCGRTDGVMVDVAWAKLTRELELARAACAECAEYRDTLNQLLQLVRHETNLPKSAANGVTDSSGVIDEGVSRADEIMDLSRRVLTQPNPGQALTAKLAAAQAVIARLRNDEFASTVAADCHDPNHDDRWCPTCASRWDGIEAYRDALFAENGKAEVAEVAEVAEAAEAAKPT